ncbi:L-aspartate oxidase [Kineococcus terrestris]|uniref:L-aspartate oxidase n=1 Tax=Kineococcus terrestris TaxID=2044856 RepID=UPI0034DABF71
MTRDAGRVLPGADCDVLVVGGGLAGAAVALELSARPGVHVLLATKTALGEGSTARAQGGMAAATGPDDVAAHAADTVAAGAGLTDVAAARVLAAAGPDAVRRLVEWGVVFDRAADGSWALGLEAAHARARVLHAGGDRTGAVIAAALADAVRRSATGVLEDACLAGLLVEDGVVRGADLLVRGTDGRERPHRVRARAVVLATGGAGQLFSRTTNPAVATGDGVAAAWRAGAAVADLEMYQFHPTAAALPEPFLVSEAVRGEGALLLDAAGHRFMPAVDERAELAPRDVVARALAAAMAARGGRPALLDATGIAARTGVPFDVRFPGIAAMCRAQGVDPATEPVPVTPAAHYWMGGVRTDTDGRTTVPGLWAAGEVACTGVHGANRLASNSLLEAVVVARRVAASVLAGGGPFVLPAAEDVLALPGPCAAQASHVARRELRAAMWEHAGLVREAAGLAVARKLLTPEEEPADLDPWDASGGSAPDRRALEDAALLLTGRLLVAAAEAREESVGAHHRRDHPFPPASPRRRTLVRTP